MSMRNSSPDNREFIHAWISKRVMDQLRLLIQAKYSRRYMRGLLTMEIENAILWYGNFQLKEIAAAAKAKQKNTTYTHFSPERQQTHQNSSIATITQNQNHNYKLLQKTQDNRKKTLELSDRLSYWLLGQPCNYPSLKNVRKEHLKQAIIAVEGVTHDMPISNRIKQLIANQCITEYKNNTYRFNEDETISSSFSSFYKEQEQEQEQQEQKWQLSEEDASILS